jgi:hypothetical protein
MAPACEPEKVVTHKCNRKVDRVSNLIMSAAELTQPHFEKGRPGTFWNLAVS